MLERKEKRHGEEEGEILPEERRMERIKDSRENERCMTEEISDYLGKKSARERKMMAKFRCRNEDRENGDWMEGGERRCRIWYEEREAMGHMWKGGSEMRKRERNGEKYWMKTEGR
jgi:hypothetical protein